VTWCDGKSGCIGSVSPANSLVGSQANDKVGSNGIVVLANSHYVVRSSTWDNGFLVDAGAVTWCDRDVGCSGAVSAANSLVGSGTYDQVGNDGIAALSNQNYVVRSSFWDNGSVVDVGAVTWCNGESGCTDTVSATNSLVGSTTNDRAGKDGIVELLNSSYVVVNLAWDNGRMKDAGAVTWCNGESGCIGAITASNSLVGSQSYDKVGNGGIIVLTNSNYVVRSDNWAKGVAPGVGAVTWCSREPGCTGAVSAANSLIGTRAYDRVGNSVVKLANGSYVVQSGKWDNLGAVDAGAITWCNGESGCAGAVSPENSLVGSKTGDHVGSDGVVELPNDSYLVLSSDWDNGSAKDAGAVTLCSVEAATAGTIAASNSVLGMTASGGKGLVSTYDGIFNQLIVGRPRDNIVSLFK
jgi:hypothetical protein